MFDAINHEEEDENTTFRIVEMVQHWEEKANEVTAVLESNIVVLKEMRDYYCSLRESSDFPEDLKSGCQAEFVHFEERISRIVKDLQLQKSRAQTLQRLMRDRKELVNPLSYYGYTKSCHNENLANFAN
jgi:hypothetical protein